MSRTVFCAAVLAGLIAAPAAIAQHQGHEPSAPTPAKKEETKQEPAHPCGHQPTKQGKDAEQMPAHPSGHAPAPAKDEASDHDAMMMNMTGVFGDYPMSRDASGTSWQPDATRHMMGHDMHHGWMVMGHLMLNAVYDWQDGPRGNERAFIAGMAMASARRDLENGGIINLRAMLSPDPFMGKSGYPLLLAAGESADGITPLIDRQHPHDFFMELSASYSHPIDDDHALFIYAGLPGEPAFGPPAFMHRLSTMDSPEAPITHHWFDSTHITFGVVTVGWVHDVWKLEVSQFTGREPDEDRFDIEDPRFDSTSARLSFNPTPNWAFQVSWADINSPEALEPEVDETRFSASAMHTTTLADEGYWSTTLAWGLKDPTEEETLHALALESAYAPNRDWTFFARGEVIDSHELSLVDETETVGKISFGAIRDFHLSENLKVGIGALYALNFVTDDLETSYDGDPDGAMVFLRVVAGT